MFDPTFECRTTQDHEDPLVDQKGKFHHMSSRIYSLYGSPVIITIEPLKLLRGPGSNENLVELNKKYVSDRAGRSVSQSLSHLFIKSAT